MLYPTLSVCLIVKDEEKVIRRCLASIKNVANEIIVVDTGSTDSTIKIALEFGAKVIESPWVNDFSFSRNLGLEEATGDWILVLDADEELCGEDINLLKEALKKPFEGYNVSLVNYVDSNQFAYVTDYVCRLFKNTKLYRFKNRIHEEIYSSIINRQGLEAVGNLPVRILHYGYIEQCVLQKEKNSRNLHLLELQLAECTKEDKPYYLYALAVEYFQAGQYKKGAKLLKEALDSNSQWTAGYRSDIYLKLILCHINQKEYYQAEEIFAKALQEYPDFVDLLYLKGQFLYIQQRFLEAIYLFDSCLELPLSPKYTSAAGVNSYRAWYFKGLCYFFLADLQQSEECFLESMQNEPEFLPAFQGWIDARALRINTWIDRAKVI